MSSLLRGSSKDTMSVLVAPIWLNSVMIVAFTFMVILMGMRLYVAFMTWNSLEIPIFAALQYGFLTLLFQWHKTTYVEIPEKHTFTVFDPTEQAMGIHMTQTPVVYLLQDIDVTGYVKIGRSTNPYHRLRDFGVKLPFRTRLVHIIPCSDDKAVEAFLHDVCASCRVNGEWFRLSQADIEAIKRFKP